MAGRLSKVLLELFWAGYRSHSLPETPPRPRYFSPKNFGRALPPLHRCGWGCAMAVHDGLPATMHKRKNTAILSRCFAYII